MHSHTTSILLIGESYRGRCTCRQAGPLTSTRQQAEDWGIAHLADIERTRARMATREMSLARTLTLYRANQFDPNLTDAHRALWKQLADEIDHRLNGTVAVEQLALFDQPERKPDALHSASRPTTRQAGYGA